MKKIGGRILERSERTPKDNRCFGAGDTSPRFGIREWKGKYDRPITAFPTESFYGLAVPANDAAAIRALFAVKAREPGKPIALVAADLRQVKKYFTLNATELHLAKKYWPGAVTIVLRPKRSIIARALGARKIGVRVPAHTGARRLASKLGAPITATSANISGQPPTKLAAEVKKNFPGILIAPGRCGRAQKPSTVVEVRRGTLIIHRQGAITCSVD